MRADVSPVAWFRALASRRPASTLGSRGAGMRARDRAARSPREPRALRVEGQTRTELGGRVGAIHDVPPRPGEKNVTVQDRTDAEPGGAGSRELRPVAPLAARCTDHPSSPRTALAAPTCHPTACISFPLAKPKPDPQRTEGDEDGDQTSLTPLRTTQPKSPSAILGPITRVALRTTFAAGDGGRLKAPPSGALRGRQPHKARPKSRSAFALRDLAALASACTRSGRRRAWSTGGRDRPQSRPPTCGPTAPPTPEAPCESLSRDLVSRRTLATSTAR